MLTLQPVCTGGYHAELHTDAVVKQCEIVDVIEKIGSKKLTPYEMVMLSCAEFGYGCI